MGRVARSGALPAVVALVAALGLGGCSRSSALDPTGPDATGSTAPTSSASPSGPATAGAGASASPTAGASEGAAALPPVTDPVSLPALMRDDVRGTALTVGRVLARTGAYTRHAVAYRADALRITGIMNVPRGNGPFPVVVLLHGHIDPEAYTTGQGFRREQDSLARNGYVVLHVDYRNHAGSDRDPRNDLDLRLGYARDAIAAVEAVRASGLPFLDPQRVALLGRSMGGGVLFDVLVARPGLVDAAVAYDSVSTDAVDNYDRWIRSADGRHDLAAAIERAHGSPESDPAFWRGVSSRTYLDRVTTPVLMHHGAVDDTCPVAWARATRDALRAGGADLTYYEYAGENHYFYDAWPTSMRRTLAFLGTHLRT